MRQQLLLPAANRREIKKTFGISDVIIGRALKFERNSSRDKRIRAAALSMGGLIFTGTPAPVTFTPNVATFHNEGDSTIHQTLGDRMELVISKTDSSARLIIDGETAATFEGVTMTGWGSILFAMQQVYNTLLTR